MKAKDSNIKVGVTIMRGEEQTGTIVYTNNLGTNLVTGQVFEGWAPEVLTGLHKMGVTPDFVIYHYYPENYPAVPDNDQALLATANWAGDAAEIRADIKDFLGPAGTNTEILVTENNTDEGNPGKQSVSLVNGLYYCDALGQIMQTEINSRVWWDLRDGGPPATNGDMSATLYGWREYGGFGVVWDENEPPLTNCFPQYFTSELLSHFIRGGDKVVSASCNDPLISAYSAMRTNGDLTLMAINKTLSTNTVNIVITNFVPATTATNYSYGMANDNEAEAANNNCDISTNVISGVSTNFSYTIAPYSVNVINFAP
jgi:alpha-L-arabinofuranosidase